MRLRQDSGQKVAIAYLWRQNRTTLHLARLCHKKWRLQLVFLDQEGGRGEGEEEEEEGDSEEVGDREEQVEGGGEGGEEGGAPG